MSGLSNIPGLSLPIELSVETGLSIGDGLTANGIELPQYKIYLEDLSGFLMLEDGVSFLLQDHTT